MNLRQYLLPLYRALRPVVDGLKLNAVARPVWAALWRSRDHSLIRARQNGRVWWLEPDVALGGEHYEPATVAWLRSAIQPGMTVIDVGANVGQLSLEMAHLVGTRGRVVSIEPSPGNLKYLRAHLSANGFDERVSVVEAACSASEGELVLEVAGGDLSSIENGPQLAGIGLKPNPIDSDRPRKQVNVRTLSLDSLCRDRKLAVDVLKVDVEGAELEVFRGAAECLRRYKPRIIFGFHPFAFADPEAARAELEQLFARAGLRVENARPGVPWALGEFTVAPFDPASR